MQALDGLTVNPARAALVNACRFRLGDALQLALTPEVRLKLCEHPAHIEKRLARRRAGVDGLLGRPQVGTLALISCTRS